MNTKKYKNSPLSLKNIETLLGYNKIQSGGIRLFLNYLIAEGVLVLKPEPFNLNINRYLINKKRIDELIEQQPIYHAILNLEYGEIKYKSDIPLPADI